MAKAKSSGLSATSKVAIISVLFGVPLLFALSSYGLSKLFEVAPAAIIFVVIIVSTIYTAHTVKLMYDYYTADASVLRFVPFICDIQLLDLKYRKPCYILYCVAVVSGVAALLPYDIISLFGSGFAFAGPFYLMLLAIIALLAVQIIKGVGIISCLKDISDDWYRMTHTTIGATDKLAFLGFIPFVRTIALYSLNKPLSTMVEFMGVNVNTAEDDDDFEEDE